MPGSTNTRRWEIALLLVSSACLAGPPRVEVVEKAEPAPAVLERTESTLDDSPTQFDQPAMRFLTFEARGEGAQVLFLASRTRCPSVRLDETRTAAFSVDVRKDAADAPARPLTQLDSGAAVVVGKSMRLMLKEGEPDLPEDGQVDPWEARPPGAEVGGLSLSVSLKEGTVLAWKVANRGAAGVTLLADEDWKEALDRGCLSLHVVGPDGHLLAARNKGAQRLAAPKVRETPPGEGLSGEVDLAGARDLPAEGLLRVILIYSPVPSSDRLASYADGTSWPRSWSGALVSNELVLRVSSQ